MSYLLFGRAEVCPGTKQSRDELAWLLASLGLEQRIHLQVGGNIAGGDIFTMLGVTKREAADGALVFLLTSPPIRDTRQELVDVLLSENAGRLQYTFTTEHLKQSLRRVQRWAQAVLSSGVGVEAGDIRRGPLRHRVQGNHDERW